MYNHLSLHVEYLLIEHLYAFNMPLEHALVADKHKYLLQLK